MKIEVSKNIQFSRLIKIEGRLREFNFRKRAGIHGITFCVDTVDDRSNRIIFEMQKTEGDWRIADAGLPYWIREQEAKLNELIEEEMQLYIKKSNHPETENRG
jgi:hypothetical protein